MAALFKWYDIATQYIGDKTYESSAGGTTATALAAQPLTMALLTSTYTFSAAHTTYANLTNELTTTGGYTIGGQAISGLTFTQAAPASNMTGSNVVWTASGGGIAAFRYAACYWNSASAFNGITKPLLFIIDNNGADVPATTAPNTLTITWNATGIFQIAHS